MKYNLTLIFNETQIKKRTEDLQKAILEVRPEHLFTEVYAIVSRVGSKDKIERKLNLINGRKLFNDATFLDIFINNLLLTN